MKNGKIIRLRPLALATAGLASIGTPYASYAQAQDDAQIQEVVVTAQKRTQAWSKVAASLSVLSADDIKSKGVSTAANLTEQVPNVQIGIGNQGGMEITIRGIGNADNGERGDPQAAFHVDGIYIARPQGAAATFFDLERVEVLRGPQGTLYGRNANAGAINLITNKPADKLEAVISTDIGNYRGRKIDGMVNVPVNDALSLRAVVSSQKHDGYSTTALPENGFGRDRDDQDNLSGRLQGRIRFAPNISWLIGVDHSRDRDAGSAYFDITDGTLPTSRRQNPTIEGKRDNSGGGVTSEFKAGLGAVDLTYLYGHRSATRDEIVSMGPAPGPYNTFSSDVRQDSHELRFSAADAAAPLQWVAGLYKFKEVSHDIDLDLLLPPTLGGGRIIHFIMDPNISESKAAFGQFSYAPTKGQRFTLGLRTTSDHKTRKGETRVGAQDTPVGVVGNDADGAWSKRTYRLGFEQDLSATDMFYASVSTGYKAGGFNDGNSVVGDPNYNPNLYYQPESIKAYEAGLKGRYWANKLQLGATVFYYDYTNLQKSAVVDSSLNTLNAGKATVKGIEFEGRLAVTRAGRLNFALGLLSAKYDKYKTPHGEDLAHTDLDRAPRTSLTLGYTHNWQLDSDARISAYIGTHYTSPFILSDTGTQTAPARSFTQRSTTKSDVTLGYEAANESWYVQAYARNLEDKSSLVSIFTLNGANYALLSEPRTVGVRANLRF